MKPMAETDTSGRKIKQGIAYSG